MKARSEVPQIVLLLAGAAALTALSVFRLPPMADILRAPSTPFDRSAAAAAAPDYSFLWEAAAHIPLGVSVAPVCEPRDPARETTLHREAVGLLPGRKILPAAVWNQPTHLEGQADFLIVFGPRPSSPPGILIFETEKGSVWRRVRS
ncbi:MAG TPA: hypothetical protein VEO02_10030 [Thermoanaerobaculia bacterium]|nr:hypothetical protein [Thermoanaerobaculia bacterium]